MSSLTFSDIQKIMKKNYIRYFLEHTECVGCYEKCSKFNYYVEKVSHYMYSRCDSCKYVLFENNYNYTKLTEKDLFALKCLI